MLSGRCTCEDVRYELESEPLFVHGCHCTWCQRETGTSYAVNALIEADRVRLTRGEVETIELPTESGKGQRVARCARCKVAVWSHYAYAGIGDRVRFVRVGTLEDPSACPPDVHIFTASKQPWVILPEGVAAVPAYYKAAELWPKASLERRDALFASEASG